MIVEQKSYKSKSNTFLFLNPGALLPFALFVGSSTCYFPHIDMTEIFLMDRPKQIQGGLLDGVIYLKRVQRNYRNPPPT